jgi:prefoldin subunit 5
MLQDPNVERYIEIAVKPLKKEIEQMKVQIEALNQALRIPDVDGSLPISWEQRMKEIRELQNSIDKKIEALKGNNR